MNAGIWILIAVLLAAGGLGAYGFFKIKRKITNFSRTAFGTDSFTQGWKNQQDVLAETPRSISSMTRIYLPQITNDFPDFNYEQFKQLTETLLRSYFNAISSKQPLKDDNITENVAQQAQAIIDSLENTGSTEYFEMLAFHNTEITRYNKEHGLCTVIFQTALEYINYIQDKNGGVTAGRRDLKKQTVYETSLVYVQDAKRFKDYELDKVFVVNCPNCGAPVKIIGEKRCEYCGSAIHKINLLVWNFNSIKEISKDRIH